MKNLSLLAAGTLAAALITLAPEDAQAQESRIGLGGVLGNPTGATLKLNFDERNALDITLGFGFYLGQHFYVHAQYLRDINVAQFSRANMDFYFGVGGMFGTYFDGHGHGHGHDDDHHHGHRHGASVGVRVPLGLDFPFKSHPLDVFVELAPGVWFINHVDFTIGASFGARYWF